MKGGGGMHPHEHDLHGRAGSAQRLATLERPRATQGPMAPPPPGGAKVQWTCPMHPEIVRDGPGSCPICGMALEPRDGQRRARRRIPSSAT